MPRAGFFTGDDHVTDNASQTEAEDKTADRTATQRPGRKFLLDLGPLVVFFAANYITGDFMLAVQILVGTTVIALAAGWILERHVSMMALVGCVAVAFSAAFRSISTMTCSSRSSRQC